MVLTPISEPLWRGLQGGFASLQPLIWPFTARDVAVNGQTIFLLEGLRPSKPPCVLSITHKSPTGGGLGAAGPQESFVFARGSAATLRCHAQKKKIVRALPSTPPYRSAMRNREIWVMDSQSGARGRSAPQRSQGAGPSALRITQTL